MAGAIRYSTGDSLFYKIYSCEKWKGPGKSIGQVGSEVFVKHESIYIRVYPCGLALENHSQYQCQIRDQYETTMSELCDMSKISNMVNNNSDDSENKTVTDSVKEKTLETHNFTSLKEPVNDEIMTSKEELKTKHLNHQVEVSNGWQRRMKNCSAK